MATVDIKEIMQPQQKQQAYAFAMWQSMPQTIEQISTFETIIPISRIFT